MIYGKYTFSCIFEDHAVLPPYKGSTIRGIFGHALKKVVCALKKQDCADCLLAVRCVYPTVFEMAATMQETGGHKRIAQPPHPYVIEPPDDTKTHYKRGDSLDFTVLLFGAATDNIPYFIYAFDQMGKMGIGKNIDGKRAAFSLQQVSVNRQTIYTGEEGKITPKPLLQDLKLEILPCEHPCMASEIQLELITPLRLKYHNRLNAELPFHVLTRAMLRRISSLLEHYENGEPPLDYRGLIQRAGQIETKESHIEWHDWRRYSNRQEQAMMMGGMTGAITYSGKVAEFIPLIRFCEIVHLGKATTFGLGKIRMHTN